MRPTARFLACALLSLSVLPAVADDAMSKDHAMSNDHAMTSSHAMKKDSMHAMKPMKGEAMSKDSMSKDEMKK